MVWLTDGVTDSEGRLQEVKDRLKILYPEIVRLEAELGREIFLQTVSDTDKARLTPAEGIQQVTELILHHMKANAIESGLNDEIREPITYLVKLAQDATGIKPQRKVGAFDIEPLANQSGEEKLRLKAIEDQRIQEAYELIHNHENK